MTKKKSHSVVGMIGEAVSDVVDAASMAATGSQLGVLELAAEAEFKPARKTRKAKKAGNRKTAVKPKTKAKRTAKRSRTSKS